MNSVKLLIEDLGGILLFMREVLRAGLRPSPPASRKRERALVFEQWALVTQRSLGTVLFAGLFVGAILALQFTRMLSQYNAEVLLGGLNTSALLREVGPLIISFLMAGKIGAYTAAELGGMKVTEQIEAIECLGADPLKVIIFPRMVAILLSSVLLLTLGLLVGILGSMVVAKSFFGLGYAQFLSTVPRFIEGWTFFTSGFKCVTYALIVGGVCCYKGFTASGGASGVGRAVTQASVVTSFYIVIANSMTSVFLETLHGWIQSSGSGS